MANVRFTGDSGEDMDVVADWIDSDTTDPLGRLPNASPNADVATIGNIVSAGTLNAASIIIDNTVSGGTFNAPVTLNNLCIISDGVFTEVVTNTALGMIINGNFKKGIVWNGSTTYSASQLPPFRIVFPLS